MTDPQTAALIALLERVEAGDDMSDAFCPIWHHNGLCIEAENAFNGSLDAAKALHEAVLPGWEWGRTEGNIYVKDPRRGTRSTKWGGPNDNPARSWLIAVLRALIATPDTEWR